jgi:hypothetical protein
MLASLCIVDGGGQRISVKDIGMDRESDVSANVMVRGVVFSDVARPGRTCLFRGFLGRRLPTY